MNILCYGRYVVFIVTGFLEFIKIKYQRNDEFSLIRIYWKIEFLDTRLIRYLVYRLERLELKNIRYNSFSLKKKPEIDHFGFCKTCMGSNIPILGVDKSIPCELLPFLTTSNILRVVKFKERFEEVDSTRHWVCIQWITTCHDN